jgi:hypothetical protein
MVNAVIGTMSYIRIRWKHEFSGEPALLYSELDENRWEIRKVEVFPDGHRGYASAAGSFGGTGLSVEPIPPLAEIAANPEFEPAEIGRQEFEHIWDNRQPT